MPEMKRTVKDSVFTTLFSDPQYARELYLYLHPEDSDVTEAECRLITIENILSDGQYNDLGLQVRDKIIVLVEAQSTFSANLPLRMLMYLAATYKTYIAENGMLLYSSKTISVPRAELYMVYTETKEDVPEVLRLSDLCGGEGSVEVTVKVLRGGDSSILGQYVEFCKIADEQRKLYGLTKKAIQETIRICLERGILVPFLTARREEVIDIMEMLFSQEEVWEMERQHIAMESEKRGEARGEARGMAQGIAQGMAQGESKRDTLYGELLKILEPLGRVSDLIAATADKAKLSALAQEFGLEI